MCGVLQMVNIRKRIFYIIYEVVGFLFNCILEIWHFLKIVLLDVLCSILICLILSAIILYPTYNKYNTNAKEAVDDNGISVYRLYTAPNLSDSKAIQLSETTKEYILGKDIPFIMYIELILHQDPTFNINNGVDWERIENAIHTIIDTQGGVIPDIDTISQKVAEIVFLEDEVGVDRFCDKILMAIKLNKKYDKETIKEFYCNVVDCGNDTKGIQQASYKYFGKDVRDLSLKQQMYICVVAMDSKNNNPYKNSSDIIKKSNELIRDLQQRGLITQENGDNALKEAIQLYRE